MGIQGREIIRGRDGVGGAGGSRLIRIGILGETGGRRNASLALTPKSVVDKSHKFQVPPPPSSRSWISGGAEPEGPRVVRLR